MSVRTVREPEFVSCNEETYGRVCGRVVGTFRFFHLYTCVYVPPVVRTRRSERRRWTAQLNLNGHYSATTNFFLCAHTRRRRHRRVTFTVYDGRHDTRNSVLIGALVITTSLSWPVSGQYDWFSPPDRTRFAVVRRVSTRVSRHSCPFSGGARCPRQGMSRDRIRVARLFPSAGISGVFDNSIFTAVTKRRTYNQWLFHWRGSKGSGPPQVPCSSFFLSTLFKTLQTKITGLSDTISWHYTQQLRSQRVVPILQGHRKY